MNELITKVEVQKIRKGNVPLVNAANRLVVSSPVDENQAYDVLKTIKEKINVIEKRRTSITKPLNHSLREVNSLFKELSQPLREADDVIRDKILEFRQLQAEKAAKEEAKRRKIQQSHKAKGHNVGAPAIVEVETGKSVTQKRWTYELVDVDKLPRKYLIPNKAAIDFAVRRGIRKIPGLRIYQKESLRVK